MAEIGILLMPKSFGMVGKSQVYIVSIDRTEHILSSAHLNPSISLQCLPREQRIFQN